MKLGWLIALCLALLAGPRAHAHTRSESHSSWSIVENTVHLTFTVADTETVRIFADAHIPTDEQLKSYLGSRIEVSAEGKACAASDEGQSLMAAQGFRRMEFQFTCPSAREIRLGLHAFYDLVRTHVNFAQVQEGSEFYERVIQADEQVIVLDDHAHAAGDTGFLTFVQMGIMHIFTGIDHMSFLLGLVLISRRLRDLIFVVTGFTIGHSLTLGLAVTGIIRPHAEFIDALVALTIALIGAENIAIAARRPGTVALWTGGLLLSMAALRMAGIGLLPPLLLAGAAIFSANYLMVSGQLRDAGRVRLLVTLVFGLIHGFGFAADLLGTRLPAGKLAQILFGFNVGVEIGQLTVVLALTGGVALLARRRLLLPRALVVDVTASGLVALGTCWFVIRSF